MNILREVAGQDICCRKINTQIPQTRHGGSLQHSRQGVQGAYKPDPQDLAEPSLRGVLSLWRCQRCYSRGECPASVTGKFRSGK